MNILVVAFPYKNIFFKFYLRPHSQCHVALLIVAFTTKLHSHLSRVPLGPNYTAIVSATDYRAQVWKFKLIM